MESEKMKNYYTVATNDDKFPSIDTGYLTIGINVSEKNKWNTKNETVVFLREIEAAKLKSIDNCEEYISREKHFHAEVKDTFRKELGMLNQLSFRMVKVTFEDII